MTPKAEATALAFRKLRREIFSFFIAISSLLIRPDLRPLFFIIRERLYCSAFLPRAETSPVQSFGKTYGAGPPGR